MSAETLTTVEMMDASTWQAKGKVLSNSHKSHQWEIADWLIEGIALYPDATSHGNASKAYDVADELFPEYTRNTFQQWVCVARTFGSLVRDKYPNLFFGHFKAVLAVSGPPPVPPPGDFFARAEWEASQTRRAESTQAKRERWLAEAQEKQLSVSALRFAINNAYEIENGKLVPQTQASTEPGAPPPKQTQAAKRKAEQGYSLPLTREQQRALETLALGRGMTPAAVAARAVAEYLETYADEVAGAAEQQAKQRAEMEAMQDAVRGVGEAERADWLRRCSDEIWQRVEPVREYALATGDTQLLLKLDEANEARKRYLPPLSKVEAKVEEFLNLLPAEPEQVEEPHQVEAAPQAEEVQLFEELLQAGEPEVQLTVN